MYMKPREVASKFKAAHWASIIRDCQDSGLSVRAFCESAGFHENRYYYWQKKFREMACEELSLLEPTSLSVAKPVFAEVKLPTHASAERPEYSLANHVSIESSGVRITADSEYPADKLTVLLREVMKSCY